MALSAMYADTRGRVAALVRGLDAAELELPVPGCPAWKVRDVVSHLAGVCADVCGGRLDGAGTDEWTGRQVAERAGQSLEEVLAEWDAGAPALEALLDSGPRMVHRLVADVATHEQDIRGAVGQPGATDSAAFDFALQMFVSGLDARMKEAGVELQVTAGPQEWTVGEGSPVTVRVPDSWELLRALSGRRSESQIRAYDWSTDPSPVLPAFNPFGPLRQDDVKES